MSGAHHLAIIGRQGSGKGTQARLLADRFGLLHVSTGDLLRREAAAGPTADTVRAYLDAGELVPDSVVDGLVARAVRSAPAGCIFDGYPRNAAQVEVLDRLVELDLVIELDLPEDVAVARLTARRVCPACGVSANAAPGVMPSCPSCGAPMTRRDDDTPAAARRRLAAFDRSTAPVLARYEGRGRLVRIDAKRPREQVARDVIDAVLAAVERRPSFA